MHDTLSDGTPVPRAPPDGPRPVGGFGGCWTTRGSYFSRAAQVCDHRQMVGGIDASNRRAGQMDTLHQHLLVFAPGTEEDVVDALVDHLRSGFQRCGRMGRRQGDRVG
jgi:hypothetical protein